MKKKNGKTKYTAAQRKAYWIGVGRSLEAGDVNARRSAERFENSLSIEEDKSYQQGLLATIYKPDMFEKKAQECGRK